MQGRIAMKTEILDACDQLAGAVINGVYQGIILTAFVALALRLLRQTNAATRYALWFTTLLFLAGMIPAEWLRDRMASDPRGDWGQRLRSVLARGIDLIPNGRTAIEFSTSEAADANHALNSSTPPSRDEQTAGPERQARPAVLSLPGSPREMPVDS